VNSTGDPDELSAGKTQPKPLINYSLQQPLDIALRKFRNRVRLGVDDLLGKVKLNYNCPVRSA
jgi:hypothetical protein